MNDKRSNKQILLDIEQKYGYLALELKELHRVQETMFTSLFGVSGTQNGGFFGSFNVARDEIKKNHDQIEGLNTCVAVIKDRQKPSRKRQLGFLGTVSAAIVAIIYGLGSKLGWW